jgi:hypothetical protein
LKAASPSFWQTLALICALPVCALMLYFLIVLIVRPVPPAYSLDAITSALGSGAAVGELDVQIADPPSPSSQSSSDRTLAFALADRLSVEPDAVRVVVDRRSSAAVEQVQIDEARDAVHRMGEMPDGLAGSFTAALRLDDGTWRVVRPSHVMFVSVQRTPAAVASRPSTAAPASTTGTENR